LLFFGFLAYTAVLSGQLPGASVPAVVADEEKNDNDQESEENDFFPFFSTPVTEYEEGRRIRWNTVTELGIDAQTKKRRR
jgi:hypothetical protein